MGTRAADKPVTDDVRIKEIKELVPPALINKEYPVTARAATTTFQARQAIHRVLHGADDRLLVCISPAPESARLIRATQRLAVAHSRDWIVDAHSDVTAQIRQQVPQTIHLEIEDWKGQTAQGDNEAELQDSLRQHIEQRKQQALEQAKLGLKDWGLIALGVVLLLMSFGNGIIVFVMGLAALGWAFIKLRKMLASWQSVLIPTKTICTQAQC